MHSLKTQNQISIFKEHTMHNYTTLRQLMFTFQCFAKIIKDFLQIHKHTLSSGSKCKRKFLTVNYHNILNVYVSSQISLQKISQKSGGNLRRESCHECRTLIQRISGLMRDPTVPLPVSAQQQNDFQRPRNIICDISDSLRVCRRQ